jgi:hypothetical protein
MVRYYEPDWLMKVRTFVVVFFMHRSVLVYAHVGYFGN